MTRELTDGQKCRLLANKIYALTGEMLFSGVGQGIDYSTPENFTSSAECAAYLTRKLAEAEAQAKE